MIPFYIDMSVQINIVSPKLSTIKKKPNKKEKQNKKATGFEIVIYVKSRLISICILVTFTLRYF